MTNDNFSKYSINSIELKLLSRSVNQTLLWNESIAYNSSNNTLVRCLVQGETQFCTLEKISYPSMQVISTVPNLALGHGNDITFNPNTNKYYVTPMYKYASTGKDENLILVLNASTFQIENEINVGTNPLEMVYGIAYNEDNNRYYVAAANYTIHELNSSFQTINSFSFLIPEINIDSKYAFQVLEVYDNKLLLVYSDKIICFDLQGNFIKQLFFNDIESEGLAYVGNDQFVVAKSNRQYTVHEQEHIVSGIYENNLYSFDLFKSEFTSADIIEKKVTLQNGAQASNGYNYIRKLGNTVEIGICFTHLSSAGNILIGTIIPGFRPRNYLRVMGACSGSNFCRFEISTDGNIYMTLSSISSITTSHWFELHVTYLID